MNENKTEVRVVKSSHVSHLAEAQRIQSPAQAEELPEETLTALSRLMLGRNEPCPCGSGKKYKKCCLPKDEAVARQVKSARAQADPVERAEIEGTEQSPPAASSLPDLAPDLTDEEVGTDSQEFSKDAAGGYQNPDLSDEENRILNDWWERVEEFYIKKPDGGEVLRLVCDFLDRHPTLVPHLGIADELLLQLEVMLDGAGRHDDYLALLRRVRREQPAAYTECFGWFDYTLIANAIARGARSEIPQYFSFFRAKVDDPMGHLDRVFHLLAWAGCEDELFELARITAKTDADDEWPSDDSNRWLCLREAIPFLASGACGPAAAERLLQAQRAVQGLKPNVPAELDYVVRQLRCNATPPSEFKFSSLPGPNHRGFEEVLWNFSGWLGRDRDRGWARAMHLARLLVEYWRWPSHRIRSKDPFRRDAETLEHYVNWNLGGDIWCTTVAPFAFLQAVVWFGEYLVVHQDWTEPRLAELRCDCARIYASVSEGRLPTEVALRIYPSFEALIS